MRIMTFFLMFLTFFVVFLTLVFALVASMGTVKWDAIGRAQILK